MQAAWAAVKVKQSFLSSLNHRLAGRRGVRRAIIAVAHRILVAAYHMLKGRQPYRDLGATYQDERHKRRLLQRMTRRIEQLGYRVALGPIGTPS